MLMEKNIYGNDEQCFREFGQYLIFYSRFGMKMKIELYFLGVIGACYLEVYIYVCCVKRGYYVNRSDYVFYDLGCMCRWSL